MSSTNNDDLIVRAQKRLDEITEASRELIGKLTDTITEQRKTITSLREYVAALEQQKLQTFRTDVGYSKGGSGGSRER
jgi:hypothetical protein